MRAVSDRECGALPVGVLVVDDEASARTFVRRALRSTNFQVTEAENLREAREQLQHPAVELALCDLSLGEENGIELLEEIRQHDHRVAAVIITANDDARMAVSCLRSGAYDYLLKPFTVTELKRAVFQALQRRRARAAEASQRQRLEMLEKFSSQNPNPILQVGSEGRVYYANEASLPILKAWSIKAGDVLPEAVHRFLSPFHSRRETIEVTCGGRLFSLTVTDVQDSNHVYLNGHDITDSVNAHRELMLLKNRAQALAFHDTLTGLPNRLLMEHRFEQEMTRCDTGRPGLAMVFVDLDRFKQINDTRGHRIGDRVLVSVAKHMSRCLGGVDKVTRWGGDELVLMLPGVQSNNARTICERFKNRVQTLVSKECRVPLSMSMGVAVYPEDGRTVDELVHAADAALLEAKRMRNRVVVFGECPELQFLRHESILRPLLTKAIQRSKLTLAYEPVADLQSGQVVGMEARIQWHHRDYGTIPPGTIVALAESSGLLNKLFRQMVRRAFGHLTNCRQAGYAIDLALRIPLRLLSTSGFASWMKRTCQKGDLTPQSVILEILDDEDLSPAGPCGECLVDLSLAGFQLSKTVMSRGRSSRVDLQQFGMSELRLDAGEIPEHERAHGRQPVETLVKIAKTLGMRLVATAVDCRGQFGLLREIGVTRIQGQAVSGPLSAQQFMQRLEGGFFLPLTNGPE